MELIEVELTEFTRRSRSVALAHSGLGLDRGLEYGERVLLRTHGEYRTAVVADVSFELAETRYRLVLGGRVPAELAETRLRQLETRPVSAQDVAELLGSPEMRPELRRGGRSGIPLQRRVQHRLQER